LVEPRRRGKLWFLPSVEWCYPCKVYAAMKQWSEKWTHQLSMHRAIVYHRIKNSLMPPNSIQQFFVIASPGSILKEALQHSMYVSYWSSDV
jgi:hypothetical protein